MLYQPSALPPEVVFVQTENTLCKLPLKADTIKEDQVSTKVNAIPTLPETLPPDFSPDRSYDTCNQNAIAEKLPASVTVSETSQNHQIADIKQPPQPTSLGSKVHEGELIEKKTQQPEIVNKIFAEPAPEKAVNDATTKPPNPEQTSEKTDSDQYSLLEKVQNLLVAVIINNREFGSLEIIQNENTLLLPLTDLATIAGFTVENLDGQTKIKTPAGEVSLTNEELTTIKNITYISSTVLKEKLATNLQLKISDLTLTVDLPWRRDNSQTSTQAVDLQPEVKAPGTGLSNLRQELTFTTNSGNSSFRSSTLLGGRLAGGIWRLRFNSNFVNNPDISEYFFFTRSGQFLYQVGKQQLSLNRLMSGMSLTGVQVGYTNLPREVINTNYGANEVLPRRSQPIQTFRGEVPPGSIVQLRVGGVLVAQQLVGLSGRYEFLEVRLPNNRTSDIELWIFDRNNLNVPAEIRSVRLNASDLLLPAGGNVQLAGLGLNGNFVQDTLFDDNRSRDAGQLIGFYQLRQGLSNNLTLEGGLQILPDTTQAQLGFVWRPISPALLATSVGTSRGEFAYVTDLDFKLDRLQISGTSQFFPSGYLSSNQGRDRFDHTLEAKYKVSQNFDMGFIARSFQNQNTTSNYILPTFSLRPFSGLSFRGRPDVRGNYLLSAFYTPNNKTRLSFNSYGDVYSTNFGYRLSPGYQLSLGNEFGGDRSPSYTLSLYRNANSINGLSWNVGLSYSDGEIGPVVGASMRVLPGLFARAEYQSIPSRFRGVFGDGNDQRFTISLVSDLSFAGGQISPAEYTSLGKERGGIAGRMVLEGARNNFNLSGGTVYVVNNRGKNVGAAKTDNQGNFFIGSLPEGIYVVEFDPEELPVELSLKKTSIVVEVASSAVTKVNFPLRVEYGLAGRITDAAGKPIQNLAVELVNAEDKQVSTSVTDEFGLYRLDGVPAGKYKLQIPPQNSVTNSQTLPTKEVNIDKEFLYDQNLQLPVYLPIPPTQQTTPTAP
ncbi:MAG TPA: carboxypeptidase regulatory-like domain-containing protein [Nostocaceae cyanobacterium]|nr:carboxypeptidase regulatory-like domain-containing protein [Nostocaceae cyanobacterium]